MTSIKQLLKTPVKDLILSNALVANYRKMWPFIKPYWFRAFLGVALAIPVGSLDAAVALFLKTYTDDVLVAKNATMAGYIPLLIIGFVLVQSVLTYLVKYLNTWVASKITIGVRKKLYDKLLGMSPSYFDSTDSGFIMMRFNSDADAACTGLVNNLRLLVSKVFSSISLVCVLFYNSWQLTIFAVGAFLLAFVPIYMVRKKMEELVRNTIYIGTGAMTRYNETFGGNRTIAAYNLQDEQRSRFDKLMDQLFNLSMGMVKHTGWLSPVMHMIVSCGLAFVIWLSSSLILKGAITSGNFTSFVAALLLLYTPVKTMGDNYVSLKQAFLAIERIFEIFGIQSNLSDRADAKELTAVKKEIRFNHVWFSYKPDVWVLKDVNLTVPVGRTLAIVGNSGGGKSTFVNLLPRFYEVSKGSITIDGKDIKDFTLHSLREQIAVVFQDNFIFSGTIRENIMIGRKTATEAELQEAVKNAHLDSVLSVLPDGIDTVLGERGVTLSGGQRQRVAIARAFLKNAPIVVLDEATSALDNKSEAVVQQALDNLMRDRTVFVIAHRLSTVINASQIIVLNEGQIVEMGTHDELLGVQDGAYRALYNAQFKGHAQNKVLEVEEE